MAAHGLLAELTHLTITRNGLITIGSRRTGGEDLVSVDVRMEGKSYWGDGPSLLAALEKCKQNIEEG